MKYQISHNYTTRYKNIIHEAYVLYVNIDTRSKNYPWEYLGEFSSRKKAAAFAARHAKIYEPVEEFDIL